MAGKLAQRNYDEKLLSEVEKQLKNIQNIIKKYEKQEIVQVEELYSVYDSKSDLSSFPNAPIKSFFDLLTAGM